MLAKGGDGLKCVQMAPMALTHLLTTPGTGPGRQAPSLQEDCARRKSGNKLHFASSSPLQIPVWGTVEKIKTDRKARRSK